MLLLCDTLPTHKPLITPEIEEAGQTNADLKVTVGNAAGVVRIGIRGMRNWVTVQIGRREGRRISLM
jgi:hypothetical protein